MEPQGKAYLDPAAVLSLAGAARLCQLLLGSATIGLVAHSAGYAMPYGTFCMASWCLCLGTSAALFMLEATRLRGCLPVSWAELTAASTMLCALLCAAASVVYPTVSLRSGCLYGYCGAQAYRIAATACSCACCAAYATEVHFARSRTGTTSTYMATAPGLLKVTQAAVAAIIFGALACESEYGQHLPTLYCVAAYSLCFIFTVSVMILAVCRRTAAHRPSFERPAAACSLLAALLYLSCAAVWHAFCVEGRQGGCPRGACTWDSRLVVATFTYINSLLYVIDLVCSWRACCTAQSPRLAQTPHSNAMSRVFFLTNRQQPHAAWTPYRTSVFL